MRSRSPITNGSSPRTRAADARSTILAAAERVFAKSGLAGARVDAIAAAAGVNKALLYYYFKSKDALYEAVIEDLFSEFNRRALEVLGEASSPRDVLLRYVNLHLDFISARHQSAPMFHQLALTGGKFLERLIQRYFVARGRALGQLIQRGMRGGEFRPVDPFQTSASIIALIVFYFSSGPIMKLMGHEDAYTEANLKKRKQHVLDFIRHGLFVDPRISTHEKA